MFKLFMTFVCACFWWQTTSDVKAAELSLSPQQFSSAQTSFQLAKSTFLPETFDDLGMGNYDNISGKWDDDDCAAYPLTDCPFGGSCERCPVNLNFIRVYACAYPYLKSGDTCVCPPETPLVYPNDKCVEWCEKKSGDICIEKTCIPDDDDTSCSNGTEKCDNGCGQKTKNCCVACKDLISSKPANSSYTYQTCKDGSGTHDIKTGWECNSGYHESNGECIKDCIANSCSGYTLSSCPANANCSSCTITASDCSTDDTKQKIDSCVPGYRKEGDTCVLDCTPNSCSGYDLTSCPAHANCSSCTTVNADCSSGGVGYKFTSCQSGYKKDGDKCVLDCTANTCEGYDLTTCPENAECETCTLVSVVDSACKENGEKYKFKQCKPNYVEYNGVCGNAEDCRELGYKTLEEWLEEGYTSADASQYTTQKTNILAWVRELVGIKNALAYSMTNPPEQLTSCEVCLAEGCPAYCAGKCQVFCDVQTVTQCDFCRYTDCSTACEKECFDACKDQVIKPVPVCDLCNKDMCHLANCANCPVCKVSIPVLPGGDGGNDKPSGEPQYSFQITEYCPYDKNYVKGEWVEVEPEVVEAGDILYSDMTTGKPENHATSGKTAIGIVYDPDKQLALGLDTLPPTYWTSTDQKGATGVFNTTSKTTALTDMNGWSNSDIFWTYCHSGSTASKTCEVLDQIVTYSTEGTTEGTTYPAVLGSWHLPAIGELYTVYQKRDIIDASRVIVGAPKLSSTWFWSSTGYNNTGWYLDFRNGEVGTTVFSTRMNTMPAIAYGAKVCTPNKCEGYTSDFCSQGQKCASCTVVNSDCSKGATKYKALTCNIVSSCDNFTLTSCPENGNCSTCTIKNEDCSTGPTKYKLDSCKSGYRKSGDTCIEQCAGYTKGLTKCSFPSSCCSNCETLESCPYDATYKRCVEDSAKIAAFAKSTKNKIMNYKFPTNTACATALETCKRTVAGGMDCYNYLVKHMNADNTAGYECETHIYRNGCSK